MSAGSAESFGGFSNFGSVSDGRADDNGTTGAGTVIAGPEEKIAGVGDDGTACAGAGPADSGNSVCRTVRRVVVLVEVPGSGGQMCLSESFSCNLHSPEHKLRSPAFK